MVDFVPFTSLLAGDNSTVYPANYVVLSGASGAVNVNTNIYVSSGGNIVIGGSTAPAGGNATVVIDGFGTNGGGIELVGSGSGGGSMSGLSGGGINFNTFTGAVGSETYTERMRIDSNGNVGIGSTIPGYKLDITGQGRSTTGFAVGPDGSTFTPAGLNAIPNYGVGYITSTAQTIISGFGGVPFYTNQLERMRIDQSGNVGINTTTVTTGYKLQVQGNVYSSATVFDGIGNVRNIVNNAQGAAYILAATDNGKMINITTGGVTVNISTFVAGNNITIYNNSGVSQTITQGASVTMYLAGTATTGNRTLAQHGICTIVCVVDSTTFVASGAGLT